MKRHTKYQLLLAVSTSMLLPFSTTGLANEAVDTPDTSNWVCKLCLISNGWKSNWDFGLIYVDDPTPKFADYRGLSDDGAYIEASGNSRYLDDKGHYIDLYGRNLGLDSRQLEMRGGKQGRFELRLNYSEVPRYLGHGTVTPYEGVGTDNLVLPQGASSDVSTWSPALLESKRKTADAGFIVKMGRSWSLDADYERQKRDGTRSFAGGTFAINGALFPAPVDYTTNIFRTGLEYAGKRGQVRLDFINSDFDNGFSSVTWDNYLAIGFGDDVSRSALEPDNSFQQVSLAGAYRISRRFRVSGKANIGSMEQNVAFLPYSINPAYADKELPRSSLNGKLETSMINLAGRAYIVLSDKLDLTAQYKVNERDNKTPVDVYTPILVEVFETGPRSNRPYSYDRSQGKAELRWRPRYNWRLNAGLKRDTLERTYQDVEKNVEDSYWGEMQFTSWTWLDTRLKYEILSRDSKGFAEQGNYGRAENPLMRKFNMIDRDRDRLTLEFDLFPSERFDLALSMYTTDDEYDESILGLTESEESSINLNFNFVVNELTNIYAYVSSNDIEAKMSGAASAGGIPWNAVTEDEILTWGIGIAGQFKEKFSYGVDYVSSDSDGRIHTDTGAGEAPFPVMTTSLQNLRAYLKYQINDNWGLALDAYNENYDSSDWHVDNLGPLDINGILSMGELSPDYDVNVVRLMATLTF
jgi:MtrB/PioB family decaheme-associated outer membrane protein